MVKQLRMDEAEFITWQLLERGTYDLLSKEEEKQLLTDLVALRKKVDPVVDDWYQKHSFRYERHTVFWEIVATLLTTHQPRTSKLHRKQCLMLINLRNQLLEHNLRLCRNLSWHEGEMRLSDACEGFMRALVTYDIARGLELWTFAYDWVQRYVYRGNKERGYSVRFPDHYHEIGARMKRYQQTVQERDDREPTIAEYAAHCGESEEIIRRVFAMRELYVNTRSLSEPLNQSDTGTLEEHLDMARSVGAAAGATPIEEVVYKKQINERTKRALVELKPREAQILILRYGLQGGDVLTLDAVGKKFGLTRERIRQIEKKALIKLQRILQRPEYAALLDIVIKE